MFIKNEYRDIHEEFYKESNIVQNIHSESNTDMSPEFVDIKYEIEFEDLSQEIKEEPPSDEEGSYTEDANSTNFSLQDDKQNISLLECSNFATTICDDETSTSPYNTNVKEIEITISPIIQKDSKYKIYNEVCLLCQRENGRTRKIKNEDEIKYNWQLYSKKPCDKCYKASIAVPAMGNDVSVNKPFCCDVCQKRFQCRSSIIRHMQVHNENKRYYCKICNKKFSCFGLIKPHMRSHTGEKPYTCSICKKKFSHKCNMQRHVERHKKVKNLKCHICSKVFPMESRLKYHMRTHTSEKPFTCGICKKVFSHKQNVLRHYSRKHPLEKYSGMETDASVSRMVWDKIVNKVVELLPN